MENIIEKINCWLGDVLNIGKYATHFTPYTDEKILQNINKIKDPEIRGYERAKYDFYKNRRIFNHDKGMI